MKDFYLDIIKKIPYVFEDDICYLAFLISIRKLDETKINLYNKDIKNRR